MTDRALSGLTILDLTQFEAGTSCTEMLGWLGANVVKIEGPKGDQSRNTGSWDAKGADSIYFLLFNANKRSVVIDLKNPEGRELFLRMVRVADAVVENFAPGALEKLGLDYPVLREANPRIIVARIKGFGLSGPHSNFKCFEPIAQATGGAISATGFPDGEPVRLGSGVGDTGTGVHTALAILAAYIQRQRTGRGQLIELSMQEVVTNLSRVLYTEHYTSGTFAQRLGNGRLEQVPYGVYPCAGGGPNDYVFILVNRGIPRMWEDFARAIDREDLLSDPRFRDGASRWEHHEEINAMTTAWTSQRPKLEVMRILGEAGVPCGAVQSTADVLDDPHLNERGAIVTVDHPKYGPYRMPNCPIRMSDSPAVTTSPPLLGQHTSEVLAELLGASEAELAELRARRVVG